MTRLWERVPLAHQRRQESQHVSISLCSLVPSPAQGDPTEWVSSHRFHHLHTDTPLDPHSPLRGLLVVPHGLAPRREGGLKNLQQNSTNWPAGAADPLEFCLGGLATAALRIDPLRSSGLELHQSTVSTAIACCAGKLLPDLSWSCTSSTQVRPTAETQATMERVGVRGNTSDMDVQPFYSFITKTYPLHVAASFALLFAAGEC